MAKIPAKSRIERNARSPVRKSHFDLSMDVINAKLDFTALSIIQV
jgi:hypothetical protein